MTSLRRPFPSLRRRVFGRGRRYLLGPQWLTQREDGVTLSDDMRLFVTTFAGGFLFMLVYLG